MSRSIFHKLVLTAAVLVSAGVTAFADGGTYSGYSPYSLFGVGDLFPGGTAYNRTMGGVGIGVRSNRFLNTLNPASITARDSLAMMADMSLYQSNKIFRQGDLRAVSNVFNIAGLAVSFPITGNIAAMVSVSPYSSTGFSYSDTYPDLSDEVIVNTGDVTYSASGQGGLYQLSGAVSGRFFRRLSLGVQYNYVFGDTQKTYKQTISTASVLGITDVYSIKVNSGALKFGLQYEQPLGDYLLVAGATYRMAGGVKGHIATPLGTVDTLSRYKNLALASEIGAGVSLSYGDKWMLAADYIRSDWTGSGMDAVPGLMGNKVGAAGRSVFTTTVRDDFRVGFEYVPNRSDIRYFFKKCAYRAGVYHSGEYYLLDGHKITNTGVTLGITMPVFRWYNGITLGVELGRRGTVANNLIKEQYVNFSIGVNLFDIWFQKPRYE